MIWNRTASGNYATSNHSTESDWYAFTVMALKSAKAGGLDVPSAAWLQLMSMLGDLEELDLLDLSNNQLRVLRNSIILNN